MTSNDNPRRHNEEQLPVPAGTALEVYDFGGDADAGADEVGLDDRITPLLRILHYQCPQIDRHDQLYVPGAEPGMIYNIATREVFDGEEGLDIVVCGRRKRYQEWIPRGDGGQGGGGFRGFHDPSEELVHKLIAQHGQFKSLPWVNDQRENVQLVEAGEMFVLYAPPPLSHDNARRAIVNFASSSLKTWKAYNSRQDEWRFPQPDGSRKRAPVWAYRWRLRAQPMSNNKGKWFGWSLELAPPARDPREALVARQDPELFEMGRDSFKLYREGRVEYRPEQDEGGGGSTIDQNEPPF